MATRVVVQGRQRFFREALVLVLGDEPDVSVVGVAEDAAALTRLCSEQRPDAVVLELDAEGWDACRLAVALRKRQRALSVIGLCEDGDRQAAQRAYRAGIRCVLARSAPVSALLHALRVGTARTPVVHLRPEAQQADEPPGLRLTDRQLEVLRLIGAGSTTREISAQLGISAKTVEHHKQRMFERLGVHNQAHAVAVAMRGGLVGATIGLGQVVG